MIPLCLGNYTNVSVKKNLILFTGGSGSGKVTPSQIYELSIEKQTIESIWIDSSTQVVRNGCFVQSLSSSIYSLSQSSLSSYNDFVLVGYNFDQDGNQISETCYYEYQRKIANIIEHDIDSNDISTKDSINNNNKSSSSSSSSSSNSNSCSDWKLRWSLTVTHPLGPVAVGISSNDRRIVIGQRINWNKIDTMNFLDSNICTSYDGVCVKNVDTGMQAVACYVGNIIRSSSTNAFNFHEGIELEGNDDDGDDDDDDDGYDGYDDGYDDDDVGNMMMVMMLMMMMMMMMMMVTIMMMIIMVMMMMVMI